MSLSNSEISFYVDTLVAEILLSDRGLSKTAQAGSIISDVTDKVKHYIGNNINPDDKVGSLLNILAPGAVSVAFSAMGLGWVGILLGFAMRMFHVDVKSILSTIWDKLKSALSGGKQMSSSQVDSIVSSSVDQHSATEVQEARATSQLLRDARMLKLALIEFDHANMQMTKEAQFMPSFKSLTSKGATTNLLTKLLGWIFKIAIAAAGLMVAGDVVSKFLGRPSALDDTMQKGKPTGESGAPSAPLHVATQTKFKVQPSYKDVSRNAGNDTWVESSPNNKSNIGDLLVLFAKQVYQGLDGLENIIKSTPGFQVLNEKIAFYNQASEGDNLVYIPRYLHTKKEIVDLFIDDVAEKAP